MNARELLFEYARGNGLGITSEEGDRAVASAARLWPPPNIPKLVVDLSPYGFSFKPTGKFTEIIVYAPEGGFDANVKALEAKYQEELRVPIQLVSHLPEWRPPRPGDPLTPSVKLNPPTPKVILPKKHLVNTPLASYVKDKVGLQTAYTKIFPPTASIKPVVRVQRNRKRRYAEVGRFVVVADLNQQGRGTVKLYVQSGDRYCQIASRGVIWQAEADYTFDKVVASLREGYAKIYLTHGNKGGLNHAKT